MLMMSKMSNMKISINIPDEWGPKLKVAAINAGAQSVADFLRAYIQETIDEAPLNKQWGGSRQAKQDAQVEQVEQDEDNATDALSQETSPKITLPVIETPDMTPDQKLRARRDAAQVKYATPKPINGRKQ